MIDKEWKGENIDLSCAIEVVKYFENVAGRIEKSVLQSVYTSVTELLSNINLHAYPSDENVKPWRIIASKINDEMISIVVEDFGVTIPVTILEKLNIDDSEKSSLSDDYLINEAVNPTLLVHMSGRGQGLKSIVKKIENGLIKSLSIESGVGVFHSNGLPPKKVEKANRAGTRIEFFIRSVSK